MELARRLGWPPDEVGVMAPLPQTVQVVQLPAFVKTINIQSVGEQNPNHGQIWPRK